MKTVSLESLVVDDAPICYGILMPGKDTDGGIPVIKVKNYDHNGIDIGALLRTAPEIDAKYQRSKLMSGDLLLSIRGSTGIVAMVPSDLEGANITQDTARIRVNPIDAPYIYQAFHSPSVQRQIRLQTAGQAVRGINISAVRKLQIPWPSASIRDHIKNVLEEVDKIIRSVGRGITARRELKAGLMQQLLTGQKRFPEFIESDQRQSGEFGTVPADWDLAPIGEIAAEVSKRGAIEDAQVYSCTKHEGLVLSRDYFGKQVFSRKLDNYKQVQIGDFAYATNHIEEGSIGLLRPGNPVGLVSPMYTVFRPDQEINPEFLFAVLKTESYRRVFEARTNASVNRRGSLRWREFSKIKVPVPPRPEQDRIAEILQMAQGEIDLLEELKAAYEDYKKGLLSRLLSGELELPES